jgi:hypothetical protein
MARKIKKISATEPKLYGILPVVRIALSFFYSILTGIGLYSGVDWLFGREPPAVGECFVSKTSPDAFARIETVEANLRDEPQIKFRLFAGADLPDTRRISKEEFLDRFEKTSDCTGVRLAELTLEVSSLREYVNDLANIRARAEDKK